MLRGRKYFKQSWRLMSNSYGRAYGDGDRELILLMAAGLISGFQQSSPGEIYEKAHKCFDILMDVLEDSDTARSIGSIINRPVTAVKDSVQTIIDLLLFNRGKDPYMSLCLPRYADDAQVTRRWKRLIVFYHPDKYSDRRRYEERAKRINAAYEETQKKGEGSRLDEDLRTITRRSADYVLTGLSKRNAVFRYKYLRRLPFFILVFSLFITVISILLFIYAGQR